MKSLQNSQAVETGGRPDISCVSLCQQPGEILPAFFVWQAVELPTYDRVVSR